MLTNIVHDLEVLQAFFANQAAWITTEYAKLSSARGADSRSSEEVESELFHTQGPSSIEELVCRMTVNELNSLIEASLQDTLVRVTNEFFFPRHAKSSGHLKLVYMLNRGELDRELVEAGLNLQSLEGYGAASEIKEITEGNKHRQRLRPVPKWDKAEQTLVPSESVVPGATDDWISAYELNLNAVSQYLVSAKSFIEATLQAKPNEV
jgi:hypothetical protein